MFKILSYPDNLVIIKIIKNTEIKSLLLWKETKAKFLRYFVLTRKVENYLKMIPITFY